MENELLFLFKYGVATGAGRRAGRSRTLLLGPQTLCITLIGWGRGKLPSTALRPHPGLQAQDRSSDSQRPAAPLQSRVTANLPGKRTARGRGGFEKKQGLRIFAAFTTNLKVLS